MTADEVIAATRLEIRADMAGLSIKLDAAAIQLASIEATVREVKLATREQIAALFRYREELDKRVGRIEVDYTPKDDFTGCGEKHVDSEAELRASLMAVKGQLSRIVGMGAALFVILQLIGMGGVWALLSHFGGIK